MTTGVQMGSTRRDVESFDFGFERDWFAMPSEYGEGELWARDLVERLLPDAAPDDVAARALRFQLARVHQNLAEMPVLDLTGVVWVPEPESGYAGAVAGFALSDLTSEDSPEAVVAAAEASRGQIINGSSYLEVEPWRGEIEGVGPFVGVRELLSHPDEDQPGTTGIEERAVYTVFPTGAAQAVQIFFSAESIASFQDIRKQTQPIVETLRVKLVGVPA
ncbi:hypothetical protein GCM10022286_17220 [Gryllotalpicola daejeonensis]|uniref:Uncharacterized protein n=1 Tax=Gryllotalpicola daejeonensis TaxID=993087 RepID=A0ABP7ZJW0_9MICO